MQKIQELIAETVIPEFAAQKSRLFLWIPVFFAVGIAVYFGLKTEPPLWVGGILSLISIVISLAIWRFQRDVTLDKLLFLISLAVMIAAVGFSCAQIRSHFVYTPMLLKEMAPVGVEGVIESIEPLGENEGSRAVLSELKIERLDEKETPKKIRLKIRKDEGLKTGQRINVLAGLNLASGPVAPNAFDFQRMAYFDGIGAVGFTYNAPEILTEAPDKFWSLDTIRKRISDEVVEKTSEPQQSVILALMTGQREAIVEENWEALRHSGLAHLLAISGLHVGMVAGVLFFFSRLLMACSSHLALHFPIKKYAAVIALVGALLYTLMVGATIPTQRALLMTGLVMAAIMLDRSPFSLRLVALAALVVLFFSPESLTSVSFQMSFAAVTALICFYEWLRPVWTRAHRQAGILRKAVLYLVGVSLTTLVAGLATGLFSLFHFQNYAMYGLLANMVAVPLMAFMVMPFIVLSYVLMPFGLDQFIMPLIEWAVGWILATAHFVANLDGSVWLIPTFPHWIFISMVLILWTMMVWKGRLKYLLVPVFIILTSLIFMYQQPDIQISRKVDLIAVRDDAGSLWFSNGRKERYTAENWLRLNGQEEDQKQVWKSSGVSEEIDMNCDNYGCRTEHKGYKVSIAYTQRAWQEDCAWADIVISQVPVEGDQCQAATVIDYFDIWRNGAYAIWLSPEQVIIRNVEQERGRRLWTQIAANR